MLSIYDFLPLSTSLSLSFSGSLSSSASLSIAFSHPIYSNSVDYFFSPIRPMAAQGHFGSLSRSPSSSSSR